MGKHRAVCLPSPDRLHQLLEVVDGALMWRARKRGTVWLSARPAGSLRPDGRLIVSLRHRGAMRTMAADRVLFALTHGSWPKGRVGFEGSEPVDLPRRARSPGRGGGLKAERARNQAALDALEGRALTVSELASALGSERSNTRKRLIRLAAQGLVEPPPRCCPDRGWMLTHAGREQALIDAPSSPIAVTSWLKPEAVLAQLGRDVADRRRFEEEPAWTRSVRQTAIVRQRRIAGHAAF